MKKNILTIGAYERDNFGDLLFYIILEKALNNYDCNIVAGSIMFSDMRTLLGKVVYPYDMLLHNYKWDFVVIVGGEVGDCHIEYALEVSLEEHYIDDYLNFKSAMNNSYINTNLAYFPDVKAYENNHDTHLIVNSVGGFTEKVDTLKHQKNKQKLLSADSVSVRSIQSHQYLTSIGVKNSLVPDVVHALPHFYPKKNIHKDNYILFQIKDRLVEQFSVSNISRIVSKIIRKYKCKIYLFMAGTANKHDSLESYVKIKQTINALLGRDMVMIITERDPLKLVEYISNAKAWIGSSLHGRIISMAYAIPRISLVNKKVSEYAAYWDSQFPYDVRLNKLLSSCELAFSIGTEELHLTASSLTKEAVDNLESIVQVITGE